MNNELKGIIDGLKEIVESNYINDWFELDYKGSKILLDYIISLQQENKNLKEIKDYETR